ncbi:putative prophage DNA binding protein [Escherichia coli]|uniref:Putative prophage DNA binding protein n=1 Tax=Escherichia coli TaxID=562 RepID=A0A2X3JGP2_ECOLX|nr:putative prophage DNA binding protein [Escherichia coli]
MVDAKILNGVSTLLRAYGRLTCGVLAEKMNMLPPRQWCISCVMRLMPECSPNATDFNDVPRPRPTPPVRRNATEQPAVDDAVWCNWRRSLPWVEGNTIPRAGKRVCDGRADL